MFKQTSYINDQLYEVDLVKSEIENKEPMLFGLFILQYAILRMLELYYNFLHNYCDVTKLKSRRWKQTRSIYYYSSTIFKVVSDQQWIKLELFAMWRVYGWNFN